MSNHYELKQQYHEAIQYLDTNFAYFLTHVLNIGRPKWSSMVPTAAVAVESNKNVDDFTFVFNPSFAEGMSPEDMGFILAHETMHIVLNHLTLCKSGRFAYSSQCTEDCKNKNIKIGESEERSSGLCHDCGIMRMKFNIAADCVINDYLVQMGLDEPTLGSDDGQSGGLMRGEAVVGYNAAHSLVSEVFDDLPDDLFKCDGSCQADDGSGNGIPCDGSCGKSPADQFGQTDDHDWMHNSSKEEEEKVDQVNQDNDDTPDALKRQAQDEDFKSNLNPGIGVGSPTKFTEDNNVGLKWAQLLEKINPFTFKRGPRPRNSWHTNHRKLAAVPETRLPVLAPGEVDNLGRHKPAIVMALDTSGSIGERQSNQFVNMARSIPQQKIKLFCCTFTTRYNEIDLEDPVWESGGTAFDPISEYIETCVIPNNRRKYPTAVVVVTDGGATFANRRPEGKEASCWYWLTTSGEDSDYMGTKLPGQSEHLDEYRRDH